MVESFDSHIFIIKPLFETTVKTQLRDLAYCRVAYVYIIYILHVQSGMFSSTPQTTLDMWLYCGSTESESYYFVVKIGKGG